MFIQTEKSTLSLIHIGLNIKHSNYDKPYNDMRIPYNGLKPCDDIEEVVIFALYSDKSLTLTIPIRSLLKTDLVGCH